MLWLGISDEDLLVTDDVRVEEQTARVASE